jgi:hypothetical protein
MAGGESQRNESEQQWREQLGTNYEMMHDDALEDLFNELMWQARLYQDPATKEWKVAKRAVIDYDMVALRLIISHVNRASFITPFQYKILKIKLRYVLKCIRIRMNPRDYNLGINNTLKAIEIYVSFLLADAVDGRKAKLLKTVPRITRLEVEGPEKQGKAR